MWVQAGEGKIAIANYLCNGNYACSGSLPAVEKVKELAKPEFKVRSVVLLLWSLWVRVDTLAALAPTAQLQREVVAGGDGHPRCSPHSDVLRC